MRLSSLFAVATVVCLAAPAGAAPSDNGRHQDTSFRSRLTVGQADSLLASEVLSDRVRALERLGSTNTPRAVERLIRALSPGGGAATAEERLTAVRELAAHTGEGSVRRALGRVLGGHAASSGERGPLDDLAQATAALALARSGTADAMSALGKALSGGGTGARAATEALVAYPPRDLAPLLEAASVATIDLANALASIGDQRAFEPLRTLVRRGPAEVRARAAIALTELGDFETVALARVWTKRENPEALRIAAARILVLAGAPEAVLAVRSLFESPGTWQAGLTLANDAPSASLAPLLTERLSDADEETLPKLIAALGRAGGTDALRVLERELRDYRGRIFAADALAHMPDDAAMAVLDRGLSRRDTRRLAALALGVRLLSGLSAPASLGATFAALGASADRDDRAAGAVGLAIVDRRRIPGLLTSGDVRVVASVAPLLLVAPAGAAPAASLLGRTSDPNLAFALALSLYDEEAERRVPTETLLALVDDRTPAAPLAARALLARDEERIRPTSDALLRSDDVDVRFHAALGLGRSSKADAVGRLSDVYRFETDPSVRRAVVTALSWQDPKAALRALERASTLDPDRGTRSAARLALGGAKLRLAVRGETAALSSAAEGPAPPRPAAVKTPSGLLLPVVLGPEGFVLVAGLPPGASLTVAPGDERGKDQERGASGDQKDERINGAQ